MRISVDSTRNWKDWGNIKQPVVKTKTSVTCIYICVFWDNPTAIKQGRSFGQLNSELKRKKVARVTVP